MLNLAIYLKIYYNVLYVEKKYRANMNLRTKIDSHGRMLIPASIRKKLDYRTGDTIVLRTINNELHALKLEQIVAEVQKLVSQRSKQDDSLVEELLQMRKQEFTKENEKWNR